MQSLSTPTLSSHSYPFHWDNACSFHITNDPNLFTQLFPLSPPISIGGVGGPCAATHAGYLTFVPSLNFMNLGLFCPSAPQTLLSLGHLHSCGGGYSTTINPDTIHIFAEPGTLLDVASLTPHSNLYPSSTDRLLATLRTTPHLSMLPLEPPPPRLFPPALRRFIAAHPPTPHAAPKCLPATVHSLQPVLSTASDPISSLPIAVPHISAAQLTRLFQALDLHHAQAHPPDIKLCHELSTGKHPYSALTSADILLMRRVFGPCPQCLEGRAYKPAAIRLTSTSPPTTHPGQTISFDPQKLPCPVLGGFTHKVLMVDEHTGHISQPGIKSKTTPSMFEGIHQSLQQTFNANGHKVDSLHGDAERVNTSLAPFLGSIGAKLIVSLPGHHAHRAERSTQTVLTRARSVAASLPYHLPPELTLLLHQSVGETLNNSICKASSPMTPNEALSGFKPQRAPIPFGRSALVLQPVDKRITLARASGSPVSLVPVTELAVSMGLQTGTDRTKWLLSNGMVVPRLAIGQLLPSSHIPFNWKPKPVIAAHPLHLIPPPIIVDPTSENLNHPIQLPNLTSPAAIRQIMSLTRRSVSPSLHLQPLPTPKPLPLTQLPNITSFDPSSTSSSSTSCDSHSTSHPPSAQPLSPSNLVSNPTATVHHISLPLPPPISLHTPSDDLPLHPPVSVQIPATSPPPPPLSPHITLPPPSTRITRSSTSGRTLAPGFWGTAMLSLIPTPSGHQTRKLANIRNASLRDRLHRLSDPPPSSLNNRYTDIRPFPPSRQQNEFSLRKALLILDTTKVHAAVTKETDKIFTKYASLRLIPVSAVEPSAVFVRAKLIIREKTNHDITARLALDGGQQPPHTYGPTHAGTSDAPHRVFVLASSLADAAHRGVKLITFSFDVPAAFINKNALTREHTGQTQLCTRMPADMPPPYGNALCEVVGAHYGLKQSNHIYDQDFIHLMTSNGYVSAPSHPYTFTKFSVTSPQDKIVISMHVDDGDGNTTLPELYEDFQRMILNRYGPLEFHSPSRGTCGQIQVVNPNASITLHYGPYILKMLDRIGMDNVPAALSPDIKGLFELSIDTRPLSTSETAAFRTINGELIHILPLRHDIRKVVTHLLTLGEAPDNGAYLKQLHLLRYLKSTPFLGPTFSSNPTDYPSGVEIHSASDCAHNVHTNGQSHGAYLITVGRVGANTSPFLSYSAAEKGVSLSPTEGEYVTLSKTAKALIHYRQFATDLGYPQLLPSIMLEDNASSIKLTTAPLIPSKSRHIALRHHHVRWAYKTQQITPQHQGSYDIVPDAATKHVGPSRFLYFRKQVFHPPRAPPLLL